MRRALISLMMFATAMIGIFGMDFGLRFNSHSYPSKMRTSLKVGDSPYKLGKEFKIGFFFNFYEPHMFGNLATLTTNDGHRVSIVTSALEDGTYRLGLAVDDKLYRQKAPLVLNPAQEDHIDIVLDKSKNVAVLILNGVELECPLDLSKASHVSPVFGIDTQSNITDVAPIELRNIRIFQDGQNTHHWDFKYHDTDTTSIDDIGGHTATAVNPHWLINDHTDWRLIFSLKAKDRIQSIFNPVKNEFYIIDDNKMITFNPLTGDSVASKINGGSRIMAFSNYMAYNPQSDAIINYNLNRKASVFLTPGTNVWSATALPTDDEPNYSNHAVAISGETLYAFGGYGFYQYRNDLFSLNLSDGSIKEIKLSPELMPMTSSAAAVVGNKLYIFGGKGNESGRQELPSRHSYAMYEYDMTTWKGKKVWQLDSLKHDFIPSQTMYYDADDDCFYMATTLHGGQMIRVARTKPEWKVVSTEIHSKMDFHDFVFDLYRSDDGKHYYLVIDKRLDPTTHDFAIYTISAPFITDEAVIFHKTPEIASNDDDGASKGIWIWILIGCAVAAGGLTILFFRHRRNRSAQAVKPAETAPSPLPSAPDSDSAVFGHNNAQANSVVTASSSTSSTASSNESSLSPGESMTSGASGTGENSQAEVTDGGSSAGVSDSQIVKTEEEDFTFIALGKDSGATEYFDREKSSISFLGGFCVRDKEGNDITVKFTSRLKHLLILLLLTSMRYESGVKYQVIDEEIWGDKDEKAAQNNRNVSMRKLRLLLEEVGNISINYDKGFFRIETNDVMFDYRELRERIDEIKGADSVGAELVNQLLELLLMGPMLPNTTYDWLDRYKADFSNSALEILTRLLKYELGRDDNLAYRIAETISLHDALNEDALVAKCQVLSRRKMLGLAKNIHAKFCKDYLKSMGEEYTLSFAEVCKA